MPVTKSEIVSYKKYVANLTQTGTSAPVATVYENDLGTVTLEYLSTGDYTITATGKFTVGKTWVYINDLNGFPTSRATAGVIGDGDRIEVQTLTAGISANNLLSDSSIEIRVYP